MSTAFLSLDYLTQNAASFYRHEMYCISAEYLYYSFVILESFSERNKKIWEAYIVIADKKYMLYLMNKFKHK